jgi:hypothetical protein
LRQFGQHFALLLTGQVAVTREGRQNTLVPEILRPSLKLLRCSADLLAEPDQRVPEGVRIEVRQPRSEEGPTENLANRRSSAPVCSLNPTT